MTKFKYFLSFCIFLILVILFFVLCPKTKLLDKKTEVVFWTVQLSTFSDYMNNVIGEFEKQHPDIKIKWIDVPYAEAEKRVLASLLSNNVPDLINITSDFNITLASKGALAKLVDGKELYSPLILRAVTYDNDIVGIPFYATSAITVYNKSLINAFGVKELPQTYLKMFNLIQNSPKISNKYLFMPTLTENDTFYKILNKYDLASSDKINTDETIEIFSVLKNLYASEKIPKESITQTHREVLEKYSAGQIAFLQVGANFLNIIKENSLDTYNNTDILPQLYGSNKAYDFSLMTLAVPLKSKHQKEAFLFASFLTNEVNQLEFSKLTGVLPCNKFTLNDEYFKKFVKNDLIEKSRLIGAKQLLSPISYPIQTAKHKELIDYINKTTEQILLENKEISELLNNLQKNWRILEQN